MSTKRIVTTNQVDKNRLLNYVAPTALQDTASMHSNYEKPRPVGTSHLVHNITGTLSGNKKPEATKTTAKKTSGQTSYTVNAGNQPYVDQLNALYGQIMARGPFQYDLNGDLLYRQMADRYTQLGQQAMMDTMGQAAALTGGYGNSYAQSVGNQAYQQYLTALNDQVPNLYQQAYNVWQNEGDRLLQMYDLAAQHPGIIEALKPRTYTYTPQDAGKEDGEASSTAAYQQMLTKMAGSVNQAATNALENWYYQLLNAK